MQVPPSHIIPTDHMALIVCGNTFIARMPVVHRTKVTDSHKIHDSLSQLCNAEKEFARTDESLQSLTGILEQIRELATNVVFPTEASEIDLQQNYNESAWLQKTVQAVKRCTEDLKNVSGKLQRLRSKSGDEKWTQKVTRAVKLFVKNKDLVAIREILSNHACILACRRHRVTLQVEQRRHNHELIGNITKCERTLSSHVESSRTSIQREYSEHFDRLETALNQQKLENENQVGTSTTNNETLADTIKAAITNAQESDHKTSKSQGEELLALLKNIQAQLDTAATSTIPENEDAELSEAIDRLSSMSKAHNGDFDIMSEEAQIMTDDVVKLLQSILEEISPASSCPPVYSRKRKSDSVPLNGAESRSSTELQDLRIIKRMRGMLESTQSIAVRDSYWQRNQIPVGHRIERQNRVFQTTVGSVAINAMAHAPTQSGADTNEETVAECFFGTLTLISKKALNQIKLRAFFTQKVLENGTFSFSPALSFHAIVPDDSLVFDLVEQGDVKRLVEELQTGSASLTDCDCTGRSLLGRWMLRPLERGNNTDMLRFLVGSGADVNAFELLEPEEGVLLPILFAAIGNDFELDEQKLVHYYEIRKILLEAGADPMLCNPGYSGGFERPALTETISAKVTESLRQMLDYGDVLVDLEEKDAAGNTALLSALQCESPWGPHQTFVEVSFEQADLLIDRDASTLASNVNGQTCLHIAFLERIDLYCPYQIFTKLLIKMITTGADVYALDSHGWTPTHFARRAGVERSWREALQACGKVPEHIYATSGVEWTVLPHVGKADDIIDILCHICTKFGWSRETLRSALQSAIQDLDEGERDEAFLRVSHEAADHGGRFDHAWRMALASCGNDPQSVYLRSGVPWEENVCDDDEDDEDDGGNDHDNSTSYLGRDSQRVPEDEKHFVENESQMQWAPSWTIQRDSGNPLGSTRDQYVESSAYGTATPSMAYTASSTSAVCLPPVLEPRYNYSPMPYSLQAVWNDGWGGNDTSGLPSWQQEQLPSAVVIPDYTRLRGGLKYVEYGQGMKMCFTEIESGESSQSFVEANEEDRRRLGIIVTSSREESIRNTL
ncbi:hypothetical protein LTS15_001407 [Exophiala xenobiotica]|nr:hypothetical protein LTS15_001407 [Exophiala xenobiotica]